MSNKEESITMNAEARLTALLHAIQLAGIEPETGWEFRQRLADALEKILYDGNQPPFGPVTDEAVETTLTWLATVYDGLNDE